MDNVSTALILGCHWPPISAELFVHTVDHTTNKAKTIATTFNHINRAFINAMSQGEICLLLAFFTMCYDLSSY